MRQFYSLLSRQSIDNGLGCRIDTFNSVCFNSLLAEQIRWISCLFVWPAKLQTKAGGTEPSITDS